jgi:hypothetical protein
MAALLAKTRAGSAAGYGPDGPWHFTWPADGVAIEVPGYVLAELGAHDGFTVVDEPDSEPETAEAPQDHPTPEPAGPEPAEAAPAPELAEPAPADELSEVAPAEPVTEAPKPAGRRSK